MPALTPPSRSLPLLLILSLLPLVTSDSASQVELCPVVLPEYFPPSASNLIVTGQNATRDSYVVRLFSRTNACSGTVIGPRHILTAAHCEVNQFWYAHYAATISFDNELFNVTAAYTHPAYKGRMFSSSANDTVSDIMLVEVHKDLPVPFAFVNFEPSVPTTWAFGRVIGFGATTFRMVFPETTRRRRVDVPFVPQEYLNQSIPGVTRAAVGAGYLKSTVCSPCFGDSGGGIFQYTNKGEPVLVGITSASVGCGLPGNPAQYTRVSFHKDWLESLNVTFRTVAADKVKQVTVEV